MEIAHTANKNNHYENNYFIHFYMHFSLRL